MEDLISKLPPSAMVVFTISLAVLFFTQRLGFWQGAKTPPDKSAAQVAAVIVDSTALNQATAAIEAHNMLLVEQNMLARKFIEVEKELADEIKELKDELRIQSEVSRRR